MITIHSISTPTGIDLPIKKMQYHLKKHLNWIETEIFGRVYKNNSDGLIVPQVYKKNGNYTKDVYYNDKKNAHIFFIVSDDHTFKNSQLAVDVKIVCMVNLNKVIGTLSHRADTEIQKYVYDIVKKNRQFEITGIHTGLKKVLEEFDTSKIERTDLQPLHIFSINTTVKYRFNNNKC